MKCFNHPEVDAVGVCKYCYKGLCKECTRVVESGIYCSEKCANEVAAIWKRIAEDREKTGRDREITQTALARNQETYIANSRIYRYLAGFMAVLACIFLVFGIYLVVNNQQLVWLGIFLLAAGALFMTGAAYYHSAASKYARIGGAIP